MDEFKMYNTLSHSVEVFKPNEEGKVKMYTCGPTVYHFVHIGNLRTYIMEDILEKSLRYIGYDVKRVMNITDVGHLTSDADEGEDKMVKGAQREHTTVMQIAQHYTECFMDDIKSLNIKKPDVIEPATNCIPEFKNVISGLLKKGKAYTAGGNVYFDTSKIENKYYVFGNDMKSEDLQVGVRDDVTEDTNKHNKADFVLWFTKSKFEDQQLKWDSPWGVGYPGWHIECSCISMKHLGEQLDIHCGGVDNIFPHHTNEVAQSEAYLGHKWCNYWFHVVHLNDAEGKMSKSKGNILTVSVLKEKGFDPMDYRFFCLSSHYKKPLLFKYDLLENSKNAYEKLVLKIAQNIKAADENKLNELLKAVGEIDFTDGATFDYTVEQGKSAYTQAEDSLFSEQAVELKKAYKAAICNDINTSDGITVIYDVLKSSISPEEKVALIADFDKVLSLNLVENAKKKAAAEKLHDDNEGGVADDEFTAYIKSKIAERKEAKKAKDFAKADAIRNELLEKGVELKDTREGTVYSIKA